MSRELRETINNHFSIEDIRTLCFDLQIDYDSLGGEGKDAKIRELLIKCQQLGQWEELISLLKQTRPHVAWDKKLDINGQPVRSQLDVNVFENPEELLGTSVGAYHLVEFVGAGGSGLVYRTAHITLGKVAALKLFYPLTAEFDSFYSRFRNGFRAIGALDHANIVKIFDFNETWIDERKVFYLVMEFVSGIDLKSWSLGLQNDNAAFQKRLQMAIKVAEALQAAHETSYSDQVGVEAQGVLHGDLKPSNILVTGSNEPILLDFLQIDMQRLLDPDVVPEHVLSAVKMGRGPVALTASYGTPGFMAPEQEQYGRITTNTDIYSLLVTFIHLFAPVTANESKHFHGLLDTNRPEELPEELVKLLISPFQGPPMTSLQEIIQLLESLTDTPTEPLIGGPNLDLDEAANGESTIFGKLKKWFS